MSALDLFPEVKVDKEADPNRRYTTREFMAWCREKARFPHPWDVDVAADLESHWSERWFCAPGDFVSAPYATAIDGLAQPWLKPDFSAFDQHRHPWGIWCNPPFDDLEAWVAKAWVTMAVAERERRRVVIAMVMPANRPEQPFWQDHVEPYRDGPSRWFECKARLTTHYPPGRVKYGHPGNRDAIGVGSADFASVLLVFRND